MPVLRHDRVRETASLDKLGFPSLRTIAMQKLFVLFVVSIATLMSLALFAPDDAEARRFGAGRSFGKSYDYSRQAAPRSPQRALPGRQATGTSQSPPTGASRWLGPLAGLAAGGLLAALLFGDAFQGLQILDVLILAALILGGILLFKAMRRRSAVPSHRYAALGPSGSFRVPEIGEALTGGTAGGEPVSPPSWFDEAGFIAGAKGHFIRLQEAWDEGDMEAIRDYCTPELFAELARERETLPGRQYTEVVELDVRFLGVAYEADKVFAGVRFSGHIKEDASAHPASFDETWHVQHAADTPIGDWYLVGIQQN
jgi:predicted lipid-binding transport protein (Tim44 family)